MSAEGPWGDLCFVVGERIEYGLSRGLASFFGLTLDSSRSGGTDRAVGKRHKCKEAVMGLRAPQVVMEEVLTGRMKCFIGCWHCSPTFTGVQA
jgi:hypothetical protein